MECAAASPRPRAAAPPGWPGDVDFIQAPDFSVLSTQDRRLLARSGAIPGVQLLSRCGERACHSCSRVMATRDWPAFEVIGELCGTVRVLAPPTAENGALEDGDVELCIDVPDGKAYEHGTNNTAGDSEAPTRLCIATRQAGTSNELAFIRTAAHSGSPNAGALNDGNSAPANANVAMVCTYLRGLPAALLVALCHIPAGQELLLNAGDHETHKSRGAPYCGVPRRTARKCAMAAEAAPASVRPAHCAELDGGEWSDWCGMYKATGARPWVSTPTFACPAKQKAALKSVLLPGASVRPISVPDHPAYGQVVCACISLESSPVRQRYLSLSPPPPLHLSLSLSLSQRDLWIRVDTTVHTHHIVCIKQADARFAVLICTANCATHALPGVTESNKRHHTARIAEWALCRQSVGGRRGRWRIHWPSDQACALGRLPGVSHRL